MKVLPKKVKKINKTTDIKEMGDTFTLISDKITSEVLRKVKTSRIAEKIEKNDKVSEIAYLLEQVGNVSEGLKRKITEALDLKKIGEKLGATSVGSLSYLFRQFPKELRIDLVKMIDLKEMVEKIEEEPSTWAIGAFLSLIREINFTLSNKIIKMIDLEGLAEKINNEINIWAINACLEEFFKSAPTPLKGELLNKLNLVQLAVKTQNANATEINRLFEIISNNGEIKAKILKNMNLESMANRINEGVNTFSLIHLLEKIISVGNEFWEKLIKRIDAKELAEKINEEPKNLRKYAIEIFSGKKGMENLVKMIKA